MLRVGRDEVPVERANVLRVVSRRPKRLRNVAIAAAVEGGAGAGIDAAPPWGSRTNHERKKPSPLYPHIR